MNLIPRLLGISYYFYTHSADEDMEVQRNDVTFSRSHSKK